MSEPSNSTRADWADQALTTFTRETHFGRSPDELDQDDMADAIADLICDLLHYADRQGLDPEQLISQAVTNHRFEREEEDNN
ncbi:hypothetical protein JD523_20115 [Aeromonas enteropelogenes]|uniref:hypothetical protein n=1 Tax=Aeromonas enteropelogenes TaxID=29489 RepID=UPI00191EE3E0|nr:hypothetical protein [Aeromonas enteropelogenes]MBL0523165.1 hypothetical protein [Aeromonas enteropelogenes]